MRESLEWDLCFVMLGFLWKGGRSGEGGKSHYEDGPHKNPPPPTHREIFPYGLRAGGEEKFTGGAGDRGLTQNGHGQVGYHQFLYIPTLPPNSKSHQMLEQTILI